jgi:glyceraldehyde-3-phosphate dehydrogenase/erythrose-4-phosphate dehydrogenase
MFKYDSTHGRYPGSVEGDDAGLYVDGKKIEIFDKMSPSDIPWGDYNVDYVVESTGVFCSLEKVRGVSRVAVTFDRPSSQLNSATFQFDANSFSRTIMSSFDSQSKSLSLPSF